MAYTTSPVVEETHVVHHDDDASSTGMIAILLIAAVLIIGFLLFAMRAFPFSAGTGTSDINVDLPNVTAPSTTPGANVDVNNTFTPAE